MKKQGEVTKKRSIKDPQVSPKDPLVSHKDPLVSLIDPPVSCRPLSWTPTIKILFDHLHNTQ
jgi:hypothetical protein